ALEEQLVSSMSRETDFRLQIEKLQEELKSAQARLQRAEQAARDARAANVQMESAYQDRISTLQQHLDTLSQGQAVIQQQFVQLLKQMSKDRCSDADSG